MQEIINLEIRNKSYMNCLDTLLSSIAHWLQRDCRMIYLDAWDFQYFSSKENLISERLSPGKSDKFIYLKKYHGISISPNYSLYSDLWHELIYEISNRKMPVLLQIDCYWASWIREAYMNTHLTHYILVLGYNDVTKELFVADAQNAINGVWCNFDDLRRGFSWGCSVTVSDSVEDICLDEVLSVMLKKLNAGDYYNPKEKTLPERIKQFAIDLQLNFSIEKEVAPYLKRLGESKLVISINALAQGRIKAALAISYIIEKTGKAELQYVADALVRLSEEWKVIFGVFVKYCYLGNSDEIRGRVAKRIEEMIVRESNVITLLKQCCDGVINIPMVQDSNGNFGIEDLANKKVIYNPIKIDGYFNNAGCYYDVTNDTIAELTNPYRYLQLEKAEVVGFDNHCLFDNDYDNIVCEGQRITANLSIGEESYLFLFMCSEFTSCKTNITLEYSDGKKENINIGVTSWLYPEPEYNNYVVLTGWPVQKSHEILGDAFSYGFHGHIYGAIYKLSERYSQLSAIILPDCVNVHLFGITIAAVEQES